MKLKEVIKKKTFWGYVLTGVGSYLAGNGDLIGFISGLVGWLN